MILVVNSIFLIIGILLTFQLVMTFVANLVGHSAISFMKLTYVYNPQTIHDRFINRLFYAIYGISHYFYTRFMVRYTYWKARLLFFIWSIAFFFVSFIFIAMYGVVLEWLENIWE